MILTLSLLILVVLSLFSVILGNSFIGNEVETFVENDLIINGTTTTVGVNANALFSIDPFIGLTATIIVLVLLATAFGVRALASGFADVSIRVIVIGTAYGGLWVLFSLLAEPLLSSIAIFGSLIYITLTIGYVWGVIQKFAGGGEE